MAEVLERRNVVLGVSGSVAVYKSAELARILIKRGYSVHVVMTKAACEFVSPLTFESLTGNPVATNFFGGDEIFGIGHIKLADWADAVVIAPATANMIAKLAAGGADCAVSSVVLASKAPLLIAPAMNVNMLEHMATQENIKILQDRGVSFVDPEEGELACGWSGSGRMASPWEIFHNVRRAVSKPDYAGKKVLITTGPTRENLDPVRFLSNRSSGKMGVALAREAYRRGAQVTLIHGPVKVKTPQEVDCVSVVTAAEMREAVIRHTFKTEDGPDIVIMAAAVSDFKPKEISSQKIKKEEGLSSIELVENDDILADLGKKRKADKPKLIGFAVETGETEDLISYVRDKLTKKNADMIVGNFASDAFDLDTNRVWIIDKNGRQEEVSTSYKSRVANKILDSVRKV